MTRATPPPYLRNTDLTASIARMSQDRCVYREPSVACRSLTFQAVDASLPKNVARMSLSMPTTSNPNAANARAASDPMSPPEPVIIATDMIPSPGECVMIRQLDDGWLSLAGKRVDE